MHLRHFVVNQRHSHSIYNWFFFYLRNQNKIKTKSLNSQRYNIQFHFNRYHNQLKKRVNMFIIDLAVLLLSSLQISVSGSIASNLYFDDFVFPLEKSENLSSCTFENGTVGRCVSLSECRHAHDEYKSGINPKLCHFEKNEPVVCCILKTTESPLFDQFIKITTTDNPENKNPSGELVERRKSAVSCEDVYSLAVPFKNIPGQFHVTIVGGQVTSEGEFPHMVRHRLL